MLKRNTRFTYRHPHIPYAVEFNALKEVELPDEALHLRQRAQTQALLRQKMKRTT